MAFAHTDFDVPLYAGNVRVGRLWFPLDLCPVPGRDGLATFQVETGSPRVEVPERDCGDCERQPIEVHGTLGDDRLAVGSLYACPSCRPELFGQTPDTGRDDEDPRVTIASMVNYIKERYGSAFGVPGRFKGA